MALIGADGNDLPEIMADGVTAYDYMAINGRVFTEHNREAFDPAFGVGLIHALSSPALSENTVRRRLIASFVGDAEYTGVQSVEVVLSGGTIYRIDMDLEARDGGG